MLHQLRIAAIMLLLLTIITGGVYPLAVTAIAQLCFSHEAHGSLITRGDRVVGSELIGQSFSKPEYFWGRLSATSPVPYNAAASSGSNYGPLHPDLKKSAEARIEALRSSGIDTTKVPVDLVTASGSGLDPHISPAAAKLQVKRVASARSMSEEKVVELVEKYTHSRQYGLLGEPHVNVLQLNLALDALQTSQKHASVR